VKWTPPTQLDVDAGRQVQRVAVAACARTTGSPAMIAAAGLGDAIAAAGLG
jgi:hypothetical protein